MDTVQPRSAKTDASAPSEVHGHSLSGLVADLHHYASDIITLLDCEGRFSYESPSTARILGYPPGHLLGKTPFEFVHPEDHAVVRRGIEGAVEGRNPERPTTFRARHAQGHWILLESLIANLLNNPGVRGIMVTTRDLTERTKAEEALRLSQAQLLANVDSMSNVAIQWYDDQGRILYWNPASEALYGWMSAEALGKTLDELIYTPEEAAEFLHILADVRATGKAFGPFESRIRRRDGTIGWVLATTFSMPVGEGRVGFVCVDVDITERKRTEEALRESEERYKALFDRSLDCVFLTDFNGKFLDANQAALDLLGLHREDIPKLTFASLLTEDQLPLAFQTVEEIRATGHQNQPTEYRLRRQDGGYVVVETQSSLIYQEGKPFAIQGIARNITERKRAETALNESERRFRELFERSPDAVLVEGASGTVLDANPAACRLHGFTRETLVGKNLRELVPPELREAVSQQFPRWLSGELKQADGISLTADGRLVPVEIRGDRIQFGDQPAVLLHVRDITERQQAERRIRQQAALLDASHDAIMVWDLHLGLQYMNPAAETLTGKTFDEARSQDLAAVLRPRTDLALRAAIKEVTTHGSWNGNLTLLAAGDALREVASRWTTLTDAEGKHASILITCNDITEHKRLENQYLRAQRLESVGTLASGVAHDLNNIFTPIIMGLEVLKMSAENADTLGVLSMMDESARRGADTIKQLLTFARGTEPQKGPVQPRHLLKEIARLLQQTFPKNIQIYTDFTGKPATVLADPSQLHQVLMNLCVNARDAMPEGGVLFVTLENKTLDTTTAKLHPKARPIPYVVFKVSDSGTGIPPEVLDRIFDPFFTTKPQGKGTGLGLATVLGIAESHDGFVTVESNPGQGTTFQVYLPASGAAEIAVTPVPEAPRVKRGQGELVLIVDDEPAILRVAAGILQYNGYTTFTATNASEAMLLFENHQPRIRAVLTDIMMPFGDGHQIIATLHDRNPRLPILAMSGLATSESQREAMRQGARTFLSKPFTAQQLLSQLNAALQDKPL